MKKLYYVCLFILLGFTAIFPQSDEAGTAKKVLIATSNSGFRDTVVSKLEGNCKKNGLNVSVVPLKNVRKEKSGNYDAIVLVSSVWAWKLDRYVKAFLMKTPEKDKKKIFLLCTVGGEDWVPEVPGVDGISSASKPHKVAPVVKQVSEWILKKTGKGAAIK